jgi:D-glycero-alpha-D-manno-heptose-7-phosphate kinase
LLIARTPLRISFFGGGTDYPDFYERGRGAVLGMAIDRHIYVAALELPEMLSYRYRLSYSRIETVKDPEDLQHPVVREVLKHFQVRQALDISVIADLPASSGLGSSSAFTVCLLKLIAALQSRLLTNLDLARQAVFVERCLLGENVGVQDQHHCTFGGLNRFEFEAKRTRIIPVQMSAPCLAALTDSLFLLHTGITRHASKTLDEQMTKTRSGTVDEELSHLLTLTDQGGDVLESSDPERMLIDFGAMLHEGWETKKRLSSRISSPAIDDRYAAARSAGALGGKLCGAGSGGFLLLLVPPDHQMRFLQCFADEVVLKVGMDAIGSTVIDR